MLLPGRATEVKYIQDRGRNIGSFSGEENVDYEIMINRLMGIYNVVLNAEKTFYRTLNLDSKNPEQALNEFQRKMDTFLTNGFIQSLSSGGKMMSIIETRFSFVQENFEVIDDKRLVEDLMDLVTKDIYISKAEAERIGSQAFINAINQYANGAVKFSSSVGKNVSSLSEALMKAEIKIEKNADKNAKRKNKSVVRLKTEGTNFLSKDIRTKIQALVGKSEQTSEWKITNGNVDTKQPISSLDEKGLIEMLKGVAKECGANQYQINLLYNLATQKQIFVNRSKAGIIGFLGELQMFLFMKEMNVSENLGARLQATGNKRYFEGRKGQEVLQDIMWNGFGFQVKNYADDKGNFTVNGTISSSGFINNRLRIESQSVREILTDFFGSYQYNQPLTKYPPSLADSLEEYVKTYEEFENIFNLQYKGLFDSYIDNMIGISDSKSIWDEARLNSRYWFNTFFLIRGRIVPSSTLLNGIIWQLKNGGQKLITSIYTLEEPTNSSYTFETKRSWAENKSTDTTASKTKITYRVTFNLDALLDNAYRSI